MKKQLMKYFAVCACAILIPYSEVFAQTKYDSTQLYVVVQHDGSEFIGQILSSDAREVLIRTSTIGDVYIPRHAIKEIRKLDSRDFNASGIYVGKLKVNNNQEAINCHRERDYSIW